jgi:hypothetical protein
MLKGHLNSCKINLILKLSEINESKRDERKRDENKRDENKSRS